MALAASAGSAGVDGRQRPPGRARRLGSGEGGTEEHRARNRDHIMGGSYQVDARDDCRRPGVSDGGRGKILIFAQASPAADALPLRPVRLLRNVPTRGQAPKIKI
jgi:hypothetical protein